MTAYRSKYFSYIANIFLVIFLSSCTANTFKNSGQFVDDSILTTKVKYKLSEDTKLNPFKIKVVSNGGHIVLTGLLDTRAQYNSAMSKAKSVEGVKSVNGVNLKVKTSLKPARDAVITSQVKAVLLKNQLVEQKQAENGSIKVITKNGKVFLSGKVNSYNTKQYIIKSVKKLSSVKSLDTSRLSVG